MNVYWGGELVAHVGGDGERALVEQQLDLVAGSGDSSNLLEFEGTGSVDGWGAGLDNVQLVGSTSDMSVVENASTGTVVATATGVDPNAGDGLSYDETVTINVNDDGNAAPTDIGISNATVEVLETFDSDATGWSNNTTSSGGSGLDGGYLGNFQSTGGAQTIYKTFELSGDQNDLTISFDFYEFDIWNVESFKIWVDDQLISTDSYWTQQYYSTNDTSTFELASAARSLARYAKSHGASTISRSSRTGPTLPSVLTKAPWMARRWVS